MVKALFATVAIFGTILIASALAAMPASAGGGGAAIELAAAHPGPAVPADWKIVETDKAGQVTGYVTWREDIAALSREFCLDYPYGLRWPDCQMDPEGVEPEADDDET